MIILPTMRGVLGKAYTPPTLAYDPAHPMTITGNDSTTPTARSNTISSGEFCYATRQIVGAVYWEALIKCGIPIFGATSGTSSADVGQYAGYGSSTSPKGAVALYTYTGAIAREGASVTANDPELTRAVDKRIGVAVDTSAKTISYYFGGVLQQTVSTNTTKLNSGPLYPHIGGQYGYPMSGEICGDNSFALQFCFGPSACLYAPPSGFKFY